MARSADIRFLLRPRWLLSHLLVVLLVVAMVNLGFWQLRRLDERRERNALVRDRQSEAVVPVEELLASGADEETLNRARYRMVSAAGSYDDPETVVVRNRTMDGVPGAWLVTPLVLENGDEVGIVRGFVRLGPDGEPPTPAPSSGEVVVIGSVVSPAGFDGTAPRDVEPLLERPAMLPGLVLAEESNPPEPATADPDAPEEAEPSEPEVALVPVPPPELSEGPHLSYAVQWFIFSAIAVVGYPLMMARLVRRRGKEVDDASTDLDELDRELAELLRSGPGDGPAR